MKNLDIILDDRVAIVGTSGSGKTYGAKGLTERLLDLGAKVCIVDPLGVWYGLRSNTAGSGPGYPVVVFGGRHGDIPIDEASGAALAEIVAGYDIPTIVDLSELPSQTKRRAFMRDFAETLYAKNRNPLHLILDEADLWAPQKPIEPAAQILGSRIDEIVRRGRVKGFCTWLITQRPAVIHKDVLSQLDVLIAMKLTSSQDRSALDAWIEGQADKADQKRIIASLPKLQVGNGIVWAPGKGILSDYQFPRIKTFDSSRTPKRGEKLAGPTQKATISVDAIQAMMTAAKLEVAANDPAALRKRIAELEKQLGKAGDMDDAALDAVRQEGFREGYSKADENWRTALTERADKVARCLDEITRQTQAVQDALTAPIWVGPRVQTIADADQPVEHRPSKPSVAGSSPVVRSNPPSEGITPAQQRVLDAVAWWRKIGQDPAERDRACVVAGYSPKASTFGVYISQLVKMGLLETSPGKITLTPAGLKAANMPAAVGRDDLYQMARELLGPQEQRVFDVIYDAWPKEIARGTVAEKVGLSPTASTAGVYMSKVSAYGLIEPGGRGMVKAADWLFP